MLSAVPEMLYPDPVPVIPVSVKVITAFSAANACPVIRKIPTRRIVSSARCSLGRVVFLFILFFRLLAVRHFVFLVFFTEGDQSATLQEIR